MSNPNLASRFDEIYNSTSKSVLAFITSKCRNTADISDIFQETYMELYQAMCKRGADYVKNEKAFTLRIARQKLARHYSFLERMRSFISVKTTGDDEDEAELLDLLIDDFCVEDFVVEQTVLDEVRRYIRRKPEDVKKVFYLYYDVGLSIPEISQALGIGESSVKNKLYRTIKEIRDLLT